MNRTDAIRLLTVVPLSLTERSQTMRSRLLRTSKSLAAPAAQTFSVALVLLLLTFPNPAWSAAYASRTTAHVGHTTVSRTNVYTSHSSAAYYRPYHPVAAAVGTALVIGAIVSSLPATNCTTVVVNGIGFRQCGSTWYQPVYQGTEVVYQVVNAPQ